MHVAMNGRLGEKCARNGRARTVSMTGSLFNPSFSIAIHEYAYLTPILLTWRKWWTPNNASKWQMGFNSAFKGLTSAADTVVLKYKNDVASQVTFLHFSFRSLSLSLSSSYQLKHSCFQSGISHSSGTDSALLLDYVLLILRQLQHQNYTRGLIDCCCQRSYKSFLHPRRVYFSTSG